MTVLQLATSIDNFIVGCKSDGIWDAIKACCILGAWDNLSGALYPLKGAAPTNVGGLFVAGDYNRKTGLVGNGSSKYLDSNRNNNADPQNNKHLSLYFGASETTGISIGRNNLDYSLIGQSAIINAASTDFVVIRTLPSTGFAGASRNNASNFITRSISTSLTNTSTSIAVSSGNVFVFCRNNDNSANNFSNARLAFYSIGESLNLALLDTRVNLLMAGIQVGVDGFDADAQAYITNVETADGQPLEFSVKTAINQFVVGCKADGIWNAIKASCILSGARTLNGALQPLAGTAPTNVGGNFVSGDYNRKTGLVGNGSTKYLNSNRSDSASPQNNNHLSFYISTAPTSGALSFPSCGGTVNSASPFNGIHISRDSNNGQLFTRNNSGTFNLFGTGSQLGFVGASRASSSSADVRSTANTTNYASTSTTPLGINFALFATNRSTGVIASDSYFNARLAFYSIGESLDLALLDARVTALITAFGVAIP
jgi:hypothetical protein